MDIELSVVEARILGSVVEKAVTTPDNYPLSLNAIVAACNQKTNRDPIMNLSESEVLASVATLVAKRLLWEKNPAGARVVKYAHRLTNTLDISLSFTAQELAVMCVLMLRGPQTMGEIRARTNRLCDFTDLQSVQRTLHTLSTRDDGPFVLMLEREPGRKEARYTHTLCGDDGLPVTSGADVGSAPQSGSPQPAAGQPGQQERIARLEAEINSMREEIAALKRLREARAAGKDD